MARSAVPRPAWLALLLALAACSRTAASGGSHGSQSNAGADAASPTPSDARDPERSGGFYTRSLAGTGVLRDASTAPDSVPQATDAAAPDLRLVAVRRWNAALARRDVAALPKVYARRVLLYDHWAPRDEVIEAKAKSFTDTPDYTQGIRGDVQIWDAMTPVRPEATFTKVWTAAGQTRKVKAALILTRAGDGWVVVEERDESSPYGERCSDMVPDLVISTARGYALLTGPLDPKHGHSANGFRYTENQEDASYMVGIFEDHPDHLAMLGWFKVDPSSAVVTDAESSDDRPLPASPELSRKVREDCWTKP